MRKYDDPVDVRRGAAESPEQFLWRGRLWQVRQVVGHWVETGNWWAERAGVGGGAATDLLAERDVWRVEAARGRVAALLSSEHDPGYGVFDLVFDWASGDWRLAKAVD